MWVTEDFSTPRGPSSAFFVSPSRRAARCFPATRQEPATATGTLSRAGCMLVEMPAGMLEVSVEAVKLEAMELEAAVFSRR